MSKKLNMFYKEQFLKSKLYKQKKDLINTLLEDEKMYTKNDVENIIKKYLERSL